MDKTYEDIKRTFNSTRKTINIGYLMNEFSLGFFEVTDYLKRLISDGVIREVEGGYAKIPPEERPSIKKVDAILAKLDADTADYCKQLVEDNSLECCNELLCNTQKFMYRFESRLERAGFLVRRSDETAKPMLALDQDEFSYFQKKIGKAALDLRMKEDLESIRPHPPMRKWIFSPEPKVRFDDIQKNQAKKMFANAVYDRLVQKLRKNFEVNALDDEWSYNLDVVGNDRIYNIQVTRRSVNTGGVVYVKDHEGYEYVKRPSFSAEKYKLEDILTRYRVSVINEGILKGFKCKFEARDDEFDVICRMASCLDALYAIKGVLA